MHGGDYKTNFAERGYVLLSGRGNREPSIRIKKSLGSSDQRETPARKGTVEDHRILPMTQEEGKTMNVILQATSKIGAMMKNARMM